MRDLDRLKDPSIDPDKHSILIVANGPSSSLRAATNLIDENTRIIRTNWFFLEKELLYGTDIDYFFFCEGDSLLNLFYSQCFYDKIYTFKNSFNMRSFKIEENAKRALYYKNIPPIENVAIPHHDALVKEINRLGDDWGLHPTTGIRSIYLALLLGYRNIKIVGIDFYQGKRFYNQLSHKVFSLYERFYTTPLFSPHFGGLNRSKEKNDSSFLAHDLEYEKEMIQKIIDDFPDANFTVLCTPEAEHIWQKYKKVSLVDQNSTVQGEILDNPLATLLPSMVRKLLPAIMRYVFPKIARFYIDSFLRFCIVKFPRTHKIYKKIKTKMKSRKNSSSSMPL